MNIKINQSDLGALKNKMDKLRAFSGQKLANEIGRTGLEIVGMAKSQVPVDTGKLKQSIKAEKKGKKVEIVAAQDYAPYIEFGTGGNVDFDDMIQLGIPASYASQFKGQRPGNLKPRPFFFGSVRVGFNNMLNRLKNNLNNTIK